MSRGFGTCPHCGTQNHVFRSVETTDPRAGDDPSHPDAENPDNSVACIIRWECFECGRPFETKTWLQGPAS